VLFTLYAAEEMGLKGSGHLAERFKKENLDLYTMINFEMIGVFYEQFGIPAHAISTFDFTNFEYYHHVDDEADKMDFNHMTRFIRWCYHIFV